jgi:hypothetical protein
MECPSGYHCGADGNNRWTEGTIGGWVRVLTMELMKDLCDADDNCTAFALQEVSSVGHGYGQLYDSNFGGLSQPQTQWTSCVKETEYIKLASLSGFCGSTNLGRPNVESDYPSTAGSIGFLEFQNALGVEGCSHNLDDWHPNYKQCGGACYAVCEYLGNLECDRLGDQCAGFRIHGYYGTSLFAPDFENCMSLHPTSNFGDNGFRIEGGWTFYYKPSTYEEMVALNTPTPTKQPTKMPSPAPTKKPSPAPTKKPTPAPTEEGSHFATCGRPDSCSEGTSLVDDSTALAVRCVSDTEISGWFHRYVNEPACADRWENLWWESDVWGSCERLDYYAAAQFCATLGARLPTLKEAEDGCVANSGCGFDRQPIWTSDELPCDTMHEYYWPETSNDVKQWYKASANHWHESTDNGVVEPKSMSGPEDCKNWCLSEPECASAFFRWSGNHCSLYRNDIPYFKNEGGDSFAMVCRSADRRQLKVKQQSRLRRLLNLISDLE